MTESEWSNCAVSEPMIEYLRGFENDRKMRLFACACCRMIWREFADERSRAAVETAERFADGMAKKKELTKARRNAEAADSEIQSGIGDDQGAPLAAIYAADNNPHASAKEVLEIVGLLLMTDEERQRQRQIPTGWELIEMPFEELQLLYEPVFGRVWRIECQLVRDIFGNPFRPTTLDPTWQTPTVTAIAQTFYDERRFEDMPILADALEEAGCNNDEILNHCRSDGVHVRGCWVVDLILGNE